MHLFSLSNVRFSCLVVRVSTQPTVVDGVSTCTNSFFCNSISRLVSPGAYEQDDCIVCSCITHEVIILVCIFYGCCKSSRGFRVKMYLAILGFQRQFGDQKCTPASRSCFIEITAMSSFLLFLLSQTSTCFDKRRLVPNGSR